MGVAREIAAFLVPYGIVKRFPHLGAPKEAKRWFADDGEGTLRLNYPTLEPDSVVFDLGGYKGEFASNIFSRYCPEIYVFEPVASYAKNIETRFSKNPKIHPYQFGLGGDNQDISIAITGDSSSTFKANDKSETVKIVRFSDFVSGHDIDHIDLLKVNIEGGEYDLLAHIIETGYITKIDNIQVQFHDFVPHAEQMRARIRTELAKTHHLTYEYEFVWENWKRNKQ